MPFRCRHIVAALLDRHVWPRTRPHVEEQRKVERKGAAMNRTTSNGTAAVLLAALVPWLGACCTTEVRLARSSGAAGTAGVTRLEVRVFEDRKAEKQDRVTDRQVVTELFRLAGGSERLVRKETVPRWSAQALEPGRYLLRVSQISGVDPAATATREMEEETLEIGANETTVADVVLADPHKARVAAVWTAVGVTLAAIVYNEISHMEIIGDFELSGH